MSAPVQRRPRTPTALTAVLSGILTLTVSGCSFGAPPPSETGQAPNLPRPSFSPSKDALASSAATTILATGLTVPWDVAALPDGSIMVTERDTHRVLQLTARARASVAPSVPAPGGTVPGGPSPSVPGQGPQSDTMVITEAYRIVDAVSGGDGGVRGIAVSPTYQTDHAVFVFYTTATDNRIARLVPGRPPQPIVTGIPKGTVRNGGGLEFGPDGALYAGTGDTGNRDLAQNTTHLAGKVLRMTADGRPAPGNPFGSLVYSYGHRSVEGFGWNTDGRLYAVEPGESSVDEVNLIQAGKDYGWPKAEGNTPDPALTSPIVTVPVADGGCSGAAVLASVMITGCLRGQRLWLVQLTGSGTALGAPAALLPRAHGRLRAVNVAADGSLLVTTSNRDGEGMPTPQDDKLLRIIVGGVGDAGKT